MKSKNSTINVTKTIGVAKGASSTIEDEDVISIHKFETTPAMVTVEMAMTLNLTNYEFAKIGVTVSVPCYAEEINEAYEFAQTWAEERISREREMIAAARGGKG